MIEENKGSARVRGNDPDAITKLNKRIHDLNRKINKMESINNVIASNINPNLNEDELKIATKACFNGIRAINADLETIEVAQLVRVSPDGIRGFDLNFIKSEKSILLRLKRRVKKIENENQLGIDEDFGGLIKVYLSARRKIEVVASGAKIPRQLFLLLEREGFKRSLANVKLGDSPLLSRGGCFYGGGSDKAIKRYLDVIRPEIINILAPLIKVNEKPIVIDDTFKNGVKVLIDEHGQICIKFGFTNREETKNILRRNKFNLRASGARGWVREATPDAVRDYQNNIKPILGDAMAER